MKLQNISLKAKSTFYLANWHSKQDNLCMSWKTAFQRLFPFKSSSVLCKSFILTEILLRTRISVQNMICHTGNLHLHWKQDNLCSSWKTYFHPLFLFKTWSFQWKTLICTEILQDTLNKPILELVSPKLGGNDKILVLQSKSEFFWANSRSKHDNLFLLLKTAFHRLFLFIACSEILLPALNILISTRLFTKTGWNNKY